MTQKFVLRLLTADGTLLGWCEEHLKPQPNREAGHTVFKTDSSEFQIVAAGTAQWVAVHWCDLDVARKQTMLGGPTEIPESQVGGKARLDWMQSIWGVPGNKNVPLPPVTVGTVVLSPPPARMGAASTA